ncbi:Gfo/Idh/MocA family oxidoreductase [Saccharophagus degradans]|uniref:Gfo/Idh/MocA family protein n=1 Tax=Saccharophagus degradans TaxID=86304 RepID=UPI001C08852D|nr:Gfo/Idh/MocA family oxidoreductase [Saccharophagus degradans]MBU2985225.1 Gfo/Idh/MocA family oxidoreductase [Saccharophagus degradans]
MKKIRWGIVSTAKIAREWLIPALHASQHAEVVAVASRDLAKAEAFAEKAGIPKAYGSYEALLADPNVDAIYNPLPNDQHVPVSMQAIKAGKHVLCEKPLGMDAANIQPLLELAAANPQLVVMEAFMYRFHPQWVKVREIIESGDLGQINAVEADFTYFNRDENNVRNKPGIGGGGLLDIGCYCISAARFIFGREPKRVTGMLDIDPQFGVDRHATGLLDFGPGMATFYCSTQSDSSQWVKISGEKGSLIVENPFYRRDMPSRLLLRNGDTDKEIVVGHYNHYVQQVDAFCAAINESLPAPTPLSDALGNIKVIDAVFKAAEKGAWVNV